MPAIDNVSEASHVTKCPHSTTYTNDQQHEFLTEKRRKTHDKHDRHGNDPRPGLSLAEPVSERADPTFKVRFVDLKEDEEDDCNYSQRYKPTGCVSKS
jgi:hypothetical protein